MDRQKLAIVLLVAVAMLFVITVGFNLRARDSGASDRPPVGSGLLKRLQSKRFLRVEGDTTAGDGCTVRPPTQVGVIAAQCSIAVRPSGRLSAPTRAVIQVSADPVRLTLAPADGPTQTRILGAGDCVQGVIGRGGGTVGLTCAPGGVCTVTLLQDGCPD